MATRLLLCLSLLLLVGCAPKEVKMTLSVIKTEDEPQNCYLRLRDGMDEDAAFINGDEITCQRDNVFERYRCFVRYITCPKDSDALESFLQKRITEAQREGEEARLKREGYLKVLKMLSTPTP